MGKAQQDQHPTAGRKPAQARKGKASISLQTRKTAGNSAEKHMAPATGPSKAGFKGFRSASPQAIPSHARSANAKRRGQISKGKSPHLKSVEPYGPAADSLPEHCSDHEPSAANAATPLTSVERQHPSRDSTAGAQQDASYAAKEQQAVCLSRRSPPERARKRGRAVDQHPDEHPGASWDASGAAASSQDGTSAAGSPSRRTRLSTSSTGLELMANASGQDQQQQGKPDLQQERVPRKRSRRSTEKAMGHEAVRSKQSAPDCQLPAHATSVPLAPDPANGIADGMPAQHHAAISPGAGLFRPRRGRARTTAASPSHPADVYPVSEQQHHSRPDEDATDADADRPAAAATPSMSRMPPATNADKHQGLALGHLGQAQALDHATLGTAKRPRRSRIPQEEQSPEQACPVDHQLEDPGMQSDPAATYTCTGQLTASPINNHRQGSRGHAQEQQQANQNSQDEDHWEAAEPGPAKRSRPRVSTGTKERVCKKCGQVRASQDFGPRCKNCNICRGIAAPDLGAADKGAHPSATQRAALNAAGTGNVEADAEAGSELARSRPQRKRSAAPSCPGSSSLQIVLEGEPVPFEVTEPLQRLAMQPAPV